MAGGSKTTTDHDEIKKWAEACGGKPAGVRDTSNGDEASLLRIDFSGGTGRGRLEHYS